MKITKSNLTRIMKIEDLAKRKAKLQVLVLSIGWHGDVWHKAKEEIERLENAGVKTALEMKFERACGN